MFYGGVSAIPLFGNLDGASKDVEDLLNLRVFNCLADLFRLRFGRRLLLDDAPASRFTPDRRHGLAERLPVFFLGESILNPRIPDGYADSELTSRTIEAESASEMRGERLTPATDLTQEAVDLGGRG